MDGDSCSYLRRIAILEMCSGNKDKAYELIDAAYIIDSSKTENTLYMAYAEHYFKKNYEKALKYLQKIEDKITSLTPFSDSEFMFMGQVYLMNGYKNESQYYFDIQKRFVEVAIEYGRMESIGNYDHYNLASLLAIQGEKEKAYEQLKEFAKLEVYYLVDYSLIVKIQALGSTLFLI